MKLVRYYPKGFVGKTYSSDYLEVLEGKGVDVEIIDTAKKQLVLTRKEQEAMWMQCTNMVLNNTRWVLDNLEQLIEYKVNWEDYHKNAKRYHYRTKKPKAL